MAPPVLNNEYYKVLQNRIHCFNTRYKDKLMFKTDDRINEDMFQGLYDAWVVISHEHTKDPNVDNLDKDVVISEEHFRLLKDSAINLSESLRLLAIHKNLGEVFVEQGREENDYTYLSHEILEICVLAMYTYTNFFQQCRYIRDYGIEPATGPRRAAEMAREMFPENWHIFEIPRRSQELFENPLHNLQFELDRDTYNAGIDYHMSFHDNGNRQPYEEVKKYNDKAKAKRIDDLDKKRMQKKLDEEEKIKQFYIKLEEDRIIEEKREHPQMGDYSVYGTFCNVLEFIPSYGNPTESREHFHAIFKQKLDIDENVLNAETLIHAMCKAVEGESLDPTPFCERVLPIYRQLQIVAFETAAKKCIENKTPIDFNDVSRKVDEVMAALYCTANPLGFQRGDEEVRINAAEILNGTFNKRVTPEFNAWLRAGAIERVKTEYRIRGIEAFNADAEAIFNSYSGYSVGENQVVISSKQIALNARNAAKGYTQYRDDIESGKMRDDAFVQATMRGSFMDKAYALEKRIETRYASFWSKLFRMVSYYRQLNALSDMKDALGINQNTRVADVYLEDRITNLVKDFSDPSKVNDGRKMFTKIRNDSATEHVRTMMKNALNGKELPHVEDYTEQIKKFEELGVDSDTVNGQLRKKQLEEEERKRIEEEERKRLEEEERKKHEEEERLKRLKEEEEAEEKRKLEERIRAEKEELYNQKVDTMQVKIQKLEDTLKNLTNEDENKWDEYKKKSAEYAQKIKQMEELEEQHQHNISEINRLQNEADQLSLQITAELQKVSNEVVSEKKMKNAQKQAEKNAEKKVSGKALKDGEKVSAKIESNNAIHSLTQALSDTTQRLAFLKESVENYNKRKLQFYQEKDKYDKLAIAHSEKWKEAYIELNNAKKAYQSMLDNKEKIIESGEGLGFDLKSFLRGDDPKARPSVFVSLSPKETNVRYTVVEDIDIQDSGRASIEPPMDEIEGRHAVNGFGKNV